tara:strand:- start:1621 stop:1977 length:357 start_codon:yes stop_codon:yes gene_type:complete
MSNLRKRFVLFIFGCIVTRLLFVYLAKKASPRYLKIMGYIALIPAIGFMAIYLSKSRKTGPEVFGGEIWWNNLRPIHSILYLIFSYLAIHNSPKAYIPLLVDIIIGTTAFVVHHGILS